MLLAKWINPLPISQKNGMAEKIKISVFIAERKYNISADPAEEAIIRQAAEYLNQQIKDYAMNYAFQDRQDLLVLIGLENTRRLLEAQKKLQYIETTLGQKLQHIDSLLQENLS